MHPVFLAIIRAVLLIPMGCCLVWFVLYSGVEAGLFGRGTHLLIAGIVFPMLIFFGCFIDVLRCTFIRK